AAEVIRPLGEAFLHQGVYDKEELAAISEMSRHKVGFQECQIDAVLAELFAVVQVQTSDRIHVTGGAYVAANRDDAVAAPNLRRYVDVGSSQKGALGA